MTSLNDKQLAHLRSRLEEQRRAAEERLHGNGSFGLANSLRDSTGELSPIDNHPGDLATEIYERGKDLSLLEQEELHLNRIDAALAAIRDGSYGQCAVCGADIPYERLEAIPESLFCVEHARRRDVSDRRPQEENFLQPPFGRTSLDEHEDMSIGFDGEDSWQVVEQWGNSDSPAMSENRDADDYDHIGIEAEENDGYVEAYESFIATDITGRHVSVVRNREYKNYMERGEGDPIFEAIDEA